MQAGNHSRGAPESANVGSDEQGYRVDLVAENSRRGGVMDLSEHSNTGDPSFLWNIPRKSYDYWEMLNTDKNIQGLFAIGCSYEDVRKLVLMCHRASQEYRLIVQLFLFSSLRYLRDGYGIDEVFYRLSRDGISSSELDIILLPVSFDDVIVFK